MFFAAWVGQSFFEATWQDAFRRHAAWLGLECHLYSRTLGFVWAITFLSAWLDGLRGA